MLQENYQCYLSSDCGFGLQCDFKSEGKEEQNVNIFHAVADGARPLKNEQGLTNIFRYYIVADDCLIRKTFLTFNFFRAEDICWVCATRIKYYVNLVSIYTNYNLDLRLIWKVLKPKFSKEKMKQALASFTARRRDGLGYNKELTCLVEEKAEFYR